MRADHYWPLGPNTGSCLSCRQTPFCQVTAGLRVSHEVWENLLLYNVNRKIDFQAVPKFLKAPYDVPDGIKVSYCKSPSDLLSKPEISITYISFTVIKLDI